MNNDELRKILDEHKVWVDSMGKNGRKANLWGANLIRADLQGADLQGANLWEANLIRADLQGANLQGANLQGANLIRADLPDHTFMIMGETYPITITNGEYLRAGCQHHSVEKWRQFSKEDIVNMDGRKALEFYPRLLDMLDFYLGKGERPDWLNQTAQ
ncbi:MAG TPA: pentapeptide repeat-containing protein [Arsenophonus apicola]|uniref:pentapeptide repeat-containing protein n=1 Tax=Arsenophonus apicola TaxID=2879119 RepID=UPI0038795CFD